MKNYGDRGGVIRKPNSITVLLFIQNNSQFKNIAKTCLPLSIHRCSVHLRQCTFRFVLLRKHSPNSRCRPSNCLLTVRLVLTLETSEMSHHFFKFTSKTTQPRPQVFSVNGALTCSISFLHTHQHLVMGKSPQTSEPAGEDTQVLIEYTGGVGGRGESNQSQTN